MAATKTEKQVTTQAHDQKIDYWTLIAEGSVEVCRAAMMLNRNKSTDPDTIESMNELIGAMSILLLMGADNNGKGLSKADALQYLSKNFADSDQQGYVKLIRKAIGA